MEEYPKEIEITQQKKAVLRHISADDAEKLEDFLKEFPLKEKTFITEEIEDAKGFENWIEQSQKSSFPCVVAEYREKIIGLVFVRAAKEASSHHFKDMILMVDSDYRPTHVASFLSREYFSKTLKKKKT
jgi:L-amino acid N-acyltransferase YncA